jgi:hypothetical protein
MIADEEEVPDKADIAEASGVPILSVVYRLQVHRDAIARAHSGRCTERRVDSAP